MEASPKDPGIHRGDFEIIEGNGRPEASERIVEFPLVYVPGLRPMPQLRSPELRVYVDLVIPDGTDEYRLDLAEVREYLDAVRPDGKVAIYDGNDEKPIIRLPKDHFRMILDDQRTAGTLTAYEHTEGANGRFGSFVKLMEKEINGKVRTNFVGGQEDG